MTTPDARHRSVAQAFWRGELPRALATRPRQGSPELAPPAESGGQTGSLRYLPLALLLSLFVAGCWDNMDDQASHRPLEGTRATRLPPAFTVPAAAATPASERAPAPPVTRALLERGRERFAIYCTPCHGEDGGGRGIVVARGFPPPPTFHQDRLRDVPAGHFYDVISHGYGAMYPYGDRVAPRDRWAIAAYIRALQRSQHATLTDVPASARAQLEASR